MGISSRDELPSFTELPKLANTNERHSWKVFGDGDELGTVNFVTNERIQSATQLVRHGLVIDLSLPLDQPDPQLSASNRKIYRREVEKTRSGRDDVLHGFYPQGSTQWDGLQHIRYREFGYYGGRDEDELDEGALGIDRLARRGIVGRGILLDFWQYALVNGLQVDANRRRGITPDDIDAVLESQGCKPQGGDILLVRTGWMASYLNLDQAGRQKMGGTLHNGPGGMECIGLAPSQEMAAWLWDNRIAAVAADNPIVEALPVIREDGFLHRRLIPLLGMPLGEFWNFEQLATQCQETGTYECLFISIPLKLPGGAGSPGNGIAIV